MSGLETMLRLQVRPHELKKNNSKELKNNRKIKNIEIFLFL